VSRQTATLVALWAIVAAAVVLSIASWIQLWRHVRDRRAASPRDRSAGPD
jgi:hypothetical protein